MLYHSITINNTEYKCKISTKGLINLEKRLGCNPLNILIKTSETNLPSFESMLSIFQESLQTFHHGISEEDVYGLYDSYIEGGNTFVDFMNEIIAILRVSGLIPNEEEKTTKKKSKSNTKNS